MSMQAHTPGPWAIKGINENLVYARGGFIAEVHGGTKGSTSPFAKANARLIAAAPDLVAPFGAADNGDWRALDLLLGHSAHGQFWRGVFTEFPAALLKARA